MTVAESISKVIPPGVALSPIETDAVVEIAYLAIAADRRLGDDEVKAFRSVVAKLRGHLVSATELGETMDDMSERAESARGGEGNHPYSEERLRTLAKTLSVPAREVAYRVSFAMGLSDMAASDEEWELDVELAEALELSDDRASELKGEVVLALNPSE